MNSKSLVGVVLALAVIVSGGVSFFFRTSPAINNTPVGSVVSLDNVDNRRVCIGGLCQEWVSAQVEATSTYPCKVRNPFTASSTLLSFNMNVASTSNMGAQRLDISTTSAPNGYGSTTPALVYNATIFTGTDSIVWLPNVASSTNVNVISVNGGPGAAATSTGQTLGAIVFPNGFVSARIATGSPGTFTQGGSTPSPFWKGTCTAVFQSYVGK